MIRTATLLSAACLIASAAGQGRPDILDYFGGHRGAIYGVSVSPDGTRVATTQYSNPTNIFDTATGKLIRALPTGGKLVQYTPDNSRVVVGDNISFTVYDAVTGANLGRVQVTNVATLNILAGAVSPDGTKAAGFVSDGTVSIWDLQAETLLKSYPAGGITAASAAFSPDGKSLSAGTNIGHIVTYSVDDGTVTGDITAHSGSVTALSCSGSVILSGGVDRLAKMWNAETGAFIRQFSGHTNTVYSVKLSPNGSYLATGAAGSQCYLWNANTGGILCALWNHSGVVRGLDFTPNSADLIAGDDGLNVNHWRINGLIQIRNYSNHKGDVNDVAISPDGMTLASGSGDNTVKLWRNGALYRTLNFSAPVYDISFSPNGTLVAASGSIFTRIYNIATGAEVGMTAHSGVCMGNVFTNDSQTLYSICTGGEVKQITTSGAQNWLIHLPGPVYFVALPPNGNFVAAAAWQSGGSNVHVLNTTNGASFRSWIAHGAMIRAMSFAPDGKLLTAFVDGTVKAWDPTNGALLWTRNAPSSLESLATNVVGDVMMTGGYNDLRFTRMSDGALLRQFDSELTRVLSIASSPDERWYAYGLSTGTFATAKSPFVSDVTSSTVVRGTTLSGGQQSLSNADQSYWRLRPGAVLSSAEAPVNVVLRGTAASETASRLAFRLVVGATDAILEQRVSLFDFQSSSWEVVDVRLCSTADQTIAFEQTTNAARFIQPGTREVRAQITWKALGPVLAYPWQSRLDQAYWIVTP